MNETIMIIHDLLGPLDTLLKRGEVAYNNYMHNEKVFLYAKIIKENNMRIRELILKKCYLLPPEQQSNAFDLITHIDIWSVLWDDLSDRKYSLQDVFTFENSVSFPEKSVESLLEYYQELKNA